MQIKHYSLVYNKNIYIFKQTHIKMKFTYRLFFVRETYNFIYEGNIQNYKFNYRLLSYQPHLFFLINLLIV